MPRALGHVFDTCQMFAVEFLCKIFMHGLPVSLKACLFSTMLRIFKPGLQCGLCNGLIPSLTCHRFCPVRSRSALHAAQAAHAVCKVKVFIGVIVTLSFKVAVAIIDNATVAPPLVSSSNSQRVRGQVLFSNSETEYWQSGQYTAICFVYSELLSGCRFGVSMPAVTVAFLLHTILSVIGLLAAAWKCFKEFNRAQLASTVFGSSKSAGPSSGPLVNES